MEEWIFYGISLIALIILYILMRYSKIDSEIAYTAAELIPQAEEVFLDKEKSGEEKKNWVVEKISEMLPIFFRIVFTEKKIGTIVQFLFEKIEYYSKVR